VLTVAARPCVCAVPQKTLLDDTDDDVRSEMEHALLDMTSDGWGHMRTHVPRVLVDIKGERHVHFMRQLFVPPLRHVPALTIAKACQSLPSVACQHNWALSLTVRGFGFW